MLSLKSLISILDLHAAWDDDADAVLKLCKQAVTPFGRVASVTVPAAHIAWARQCLSEHHGKHIAVATVLNGEALLSYQETISRAANALQFGAQELEWHCPSAAEEQGRTLIALQALCLPYQARLKIILPEEITAQERVLQWAQQQGVAWVQNEAKHGDSIDSLRSLCQAALPRGLGIKIHNGAHHWVQTEALLRSLEALPAPPSLRLGCHFPLLNELLQELGATGL